MIDICIGCSRCLVAFNRKDGYFELYEDVDAQVVGLLNCGDCPGTTIVTRLSQFNLWNKPMDERITAVHIGPCLLEHCPHVETIIKKIKAKSGVTVIEGTHTYKPENIFA